MDTLSCWVPSYPFYIVNKILLNQFKIKTDKWHLTADYLLSRKKKLAKMGKMAPLCAFRMRKVAPSSGTFAVSGICGKGFFQHILNKWRNQLQTKLSVPCALHLESMMIPIGIHWISISHWTFVHIWPKKQHTQWKYFPQLSKTKKKSVYRSIYLSVYLSIYLPIYLTIYQTI